MINRARGEFETSVCGEVCCFDTRLSTIATIEARCGDTGIVEVVNKAVFGRRARDQIALLAAALVAAGREPAAADRLAAGASVSEAEGFILALMAALGFEVAPRQDGEAPPLHRASAGVTGASSPSAP